MIAWGSSAFNFPIEDLAWKISCFVVASGGIFTFAGIFGLDIATRRRKANRRMDIMMGFVYIATPISAVYVLLYLVCRVYLVFEVFRNLAFLDPKVFETPDVSPFPWVILGYHHIAPHPIDELKAYSFCSGTSTFPIYRESRPIHVGCRQIFHDGLEAYGEPKKTKAHNADYSRTLLDSETLEAVDVLQSPDYCSPPLGISGASKAKARSSTVIPPQSTHTQPPLR